jgi:hypothetical protein
MEAGTAGQSINDSLDPGSRTASESNIILYAFHQVIKRWWLFLIIGFLGGVAGFIYASKQKPVYESYLSFALDEGGSEGGLSGAFGLAAQFGISIGGAKDVFTGDNILEIMLSRRVIERVLLATDTFDNKRLTMVQFYLENDPSQNKKRSTTPNVQFHPDESRSDFSYAKDSILYAAFLDFRANHISARRPNKRLNIYELVVTSYNEKFSKVFTDKLIYETNLFYTEISSKKARETLEILEKRVPDMKGKLNAAISNKAALQDANLNTAFANAQVPMLKEQSNAQVYGAAYAEMFKNLEMARFQYLRSIPLMQVIDAAGYPMKKVKPGKIRTAIIFSIITGLIFLFIFITIHFVGYRRQVSK